MPLPRGQLSRSEKIEKSRVQEWRGPAKPWAKPIGTSEK